MKNIIILIVFFFSYDLLLAESRIRNIIIDKHEVFDSTDGDWFFAGALANFFHTTTKDYIIKDEFLFQSDEYLDEDKFNETERNLRKTFLFTKVRISLDSIDDLNYDVIVHTKDKWSLQPALLFGSGGGNNNLGLRIAESNLIGTGTELSIEALNRTENNIGLQGIGILNKERIFRTPYTLNLAIVANKIRTDQVLKILSPYRTFATTMAYGIEAQNSYGNDFLYNRRLDTVLFLPFHLKKILAWWSNAWLKSDKVFFTTLFEYDDVDRSKPEYRRAFDNSGKLLFQFSSVTNNYEKVTKINNYLDEDMPLGGYGSAILGKIFPIGNRGESYFYTGAQGEQSYYLGNLYIFAELAAGSCFAQSEGKYTYQEFNGNVFYRLSEDLIFTTRFKQQTTWNWGALRQLILDNDAGLRGYKLNSLSGDNRIIANAELRFLPNYTFWIFNASAVAFWDLGTVWDQSMKLYQTQFHHSVGFGFRLHNNKSTKEGNTLRFDFAYNFDTKKIGFIFTSDQLFSAFNKHEFKLPKLFGSEFEGE